MRRILEYLFDSHDEDGEVKRELCDMTNEVDGTTSAACYTSILVGYLNQTNEAYEDSHGIIHEIYEGEDQLFAYIFEVETDEEIESELRNLFKNAGYDEALIEERTKEALAQLQTS